jgi:hypothetical protein
MRHCSLPALLSCALLLTLLSLVMPADQVQAQGYRGRDFQSGTRTGFGYTGAIPEALLGAGLLHFFRTSGIGTFADWKMTAERLKNDADYCPTALTVCDVAWVEAERNDQQLRVEDDWLVFNAGAMYALTRELAVMIGGGLARRDQIAEFFHDTNDDDTRITPNGTYFVDNPPGSGWIGQFVVGGLLRAGNNLAFRFGYETAPGGMSIGVYMVLP